MTKVLQISLLSLLLCALAAGDSRSWQQSLSKVSAGPYKTKKQCTLNYKLSWNGTINSGDVSVTFNKNTGSAKTVKLTSTGKSSGLARRLFPYDFNITTKYRGDTLMPVSYHIWENTKEETKQIDGYFSGSKVTAKEKSVPHDTKKAKYKTSTFDYPNLLDLYTATLQIGSQPLKNGDQLNLVTYPFDKPYLIMVKVLGREMHNGQDCIKLDLKMNKINRDLTLKTYDKMKKTTMWITDNPDRVMVDLRSKIFIGDVRCTLVSSKWD